MTLPRKYLLHLLAALCLCVLPACYTVERTKKIELTKSDLKTIAPSAEEQFLADVRGVALDNWLPGKRFQATDDRAVLLFSQEGMPADPAVVAIGGKTLIYQGINAKLRPDGTEDVVLLFFDGNKTYQLPTGKKGSELSNYLSTDLPMMVDLELVETLNSKLSGRQLWTRSSLWYDDQGERFAGEKFVPVKILGVEPGNAEFPVKISFEDGRGRRSFFWMSFGRSAADSRPFASLFSMTDPRLLYPDVEDHVWRLIQTGQVAQGMKKELCRLALGNPSEVNSGHDYSRLIDIWTYPDGRVLRFEDGVLEAYGMKRD